MTDQFGGYVVWPGEPDQPHLYDRIAPLAKRLGVTPVDPKACVGRVLICGRDKVNYDVFELVHAFLNKVDTATEE